MKLYEITSTLKNVLDNLEFAMDTGDEHRVAMLSDSLGDWQYAFEDKIVAIAAMRANLLVESGAIKDIIKRQQARVKALEARAEWFESYAISGMHQTGKTDVNTPEMRVRISTGTGSVEITDSTKIPDKFFKVVKSIELNKAELRDELLKMKKAGEPPMVEGAHLVFNEKLKVG
jgi:hypothetical protein